MNILKNSKKININKKFINYNFIDSVIIKQIGTKLEVYQEKIYIFSKSDIIIDDIKKLYDETKVILTAIIFVKENFYSMANTIEVGKKVRLRYIYARLKLIEKRLGKSLKYLSYLMKFYHNNGLNSYKDKIKNKYYKYILFKYKKKFNDNIFFSNLFLQEIKKEYEMNKLFDLDIVKHRINKSNLKIGDIVLSYKTQKFLDSVLLSKLISIAQKSNITHSSIISKVDGDYVEHINPTVDYDNIIVNQELINRKYEIFFIMRPKIKKYIYDELKLELTKLKNEIEGKTVVYKFAEYKQWYATLVGLIYSNSIYFFKKILIFKNIFKDDNAFYCSEFIDYVYKKVGIYLLPRSEYNSIVGPAELLYSPYLEFVGIIYNQDEIEFIKNEKIIV